jgi:hypothetical protein
MVNYRSNFTLLFIGLKHHGNLLPFHLNFQGNIALQHRMTVLPRMVVNYCGKKINSIGPWRQKLAADFASFEGKY